MTLKDQRYLVARWQAFLGGREPHNDIMREFYLAEVVSMDLYEYGIACEVFDVLINGIFDLQAAASWNSRGPDTGTDTGPDADAPDAAAMTVAAA